MSLSIYEAQADGEDQRFLCPVMSEALVQKVAAEVKGSGQCQTFCKGCGCKGGPGFRATNGECVAWADVVEKCGGPPHNDCTKECVPVVKACVGRAFGRAWLKTFAASIGLPVSFLPADVSPKSATTTPELQPK